MIRLSKQEELNKISEDMFHGKKIKYALTIYNPKCMVFSVQLYFDKIEVKGTYVFLKSGEEFVANIDKEIFKLKFATYEPTGRTKHYRLYM